MFEVCIQIKVSRFLCVIVDLDYALKRYKSRAHNHTLSELLPPTLPTHSWWVMHTNQFLSREKKEKLNKTKQSTTGQKTRTEETTTRTTTTCKIKQGKKDKLKNKKRKRKGASINNTLRTPLSWTVMGKRMRRNGCLLVTAVMEFGLFPNFSVICLDHIQKTCNW